MEYILYVDHPGLAELWEWSYFLSPSEFLGRVYERYPSLRNVPVGTEVKVKVE